MYASAASAHVDWLAAALYAAELGEPFDLVHCEADVALELFAALPRLRGSVPYATMRLLGRLANDERAEVRVGVARALPWFAELYSDHVEQLLLPLACDPDRRVRSATVEALADLLESAGDGQSLIERWQFHPQRAREVLARAQKLLPPPLGTR